MATFWVPASAKKIAHPAFICALLSVGFQSLWGVMTGQSGSQMLFDYFGKGGGAGDLISAFLGPSIITFGLQLYQQRQLLASNSFRFFMTTLFSAMFGLTSSSFLSKLVGLSPLAVSMSPLTRCITTPLALAGAKLTGADPSLAALSVVVSGLLGASLGSSWLSFLGFKDDITLGLAIGAASHGLGSASVSNEPTKFAASIVSMTLTGLFTVILLSFATVRNVL